jgi:hypothetical protein
MGKEGGFLNLWKRAGHSWLRGSEQCGQCAGKARAKREASQMQAPCKPIAKHLPSFSPLVYLLFTSYSPLVLLPFPRVGAAGRTASLPQRCFLLTAPQQKRSKWIRRLWRRSDYRPRPAREGSVTPGAPAAPQIPPHPDRSPAFTARTAWRALPSASLFTPPSTDRGRGPGSGPGRRGGWAEDCRR